MRLFMPPYNLAVIWLYLAGKDYYHSIGMVSKRVWVIEFFVKPFDEHC